MPRRQARIGTKPAPTLELRGHAKAPTPTHATLSSNRRISNRAALRSAATVVLPNAAPRQVQMWDIAVDGASLMSPRPIAQGSTLELRLVLPGTPEPVIATARVVYSSYLALNEFKVGLVFTRLDDAGIAAIVAFVA